MKYLLLLACCIAMTTSTFAQRMAHDRYTVSGGLIGALNYNSIRVGGENSLNLDFNSRLGWSAGAFLNLPLGHAFSVEPQVMYSFYSYQSMNNASPFLPYGGVSAVTIPILIKIDLHRDFALTFGPQVDFLGNLKKAAPSVDKDDIATPAFSLSAGFELLPHGDLTLFGRYVHGFSNLDNRGVDDDAEYFNSNFQAGIKVKLFGDVIPADTDGDGIPDVDDLCPTVSGLAIMNGCPDTDSDGITDAIDSCPTVAGFSRYNGCPIPDTDMDGVNDEVDQCITVAGIAKYNGCPIPDTDGDGVNDENDKCITVAGLAKYSGCPIPDTDGDGVNDEIDKCPSVAGLAQFDGCPNPDRDNDGVPDAEDHCPTIKGPKDNDGCPVVESAVFNARMINFVTASANLTPQAKKDIKEGAKLLNSGEFANLKIEIQGHTDSDGSNDYNHKLSHRRAESVRAELIKNGVNPDRLTASGYGEEKPIADNSTVAGKALNRRVVLKPRE